jgi:hypothetical protein
LKARTGELAGNKGFYVVLFLSWGIDYRIKNEKTKSGRITSWTFVHPISHCDFGGKKLLGKEHKSTIIS